jgi:hypothetical protein
VPGRNIANTRTSPRLGAGMWDMSARDPNSGDFIVTSILETKGRISGRQKIVTNNGHKTGAEM